MKYSLLLCAVALICLSFAGDKNGAIDELRLNQVQVLASHNSYHMRTDKAILRMLHNLYALHLMPKDLNPREIDYTNVPLTEQFEKYGVRGIELDVYSDPTGGRFYDRRGLAWVGKKHKSHIEALKKPGFKMIHIPDIDFNSTNLTFIDALTEVKRWSDAHPDHIPVFIHVEPKIETPGDAVHQLRKMAHAAPFDSLAFEALDAEVRSVFGSNLSSVITPDIVRGTYPTLEKAVLDGHWPTLQASRGKVVFILDADQKLLDVYRRGHASFTGRPMFVYAQPGMAEAAFVIHNDPERDHAEIQKCVKAGYIVRTRCDGGTVQARTGDYTQMYSAMSSWGQIISTDYYKPDNRAGNKGWTDYHVRFANEALARIDSISAPGKEKIGVIKE